MATAEVSIAGLVLSMLLALGGCASAGTVPERAPGPTPTKAPWPELWDSFVCAGLKQLGDANVHLQALAEARAALDFDDVAVEADEISTDAKEAADLFGSAPSWPPGATLLNHLRQASLHYRKAANLLKLRADALDVELVNEGIAEATKGSKRVTAASDESDNLRALGWVGC